MVRRGAFTRQGAMAVAGLGAIALAALQAQGNGAWLFALLLTSAGGLSWWWNRRRLDRVRLHLPLPPRHHGAERVLPVRVDGLPRLWLTALVVRADGREERGPMTRVTDGDSLLPLPPAQPGDHPTLAVAAQDRWPWGWFRQQRRWTCDLGTESDRPATVGTPEEWTGLRPWRPGDGLGRLVWRRLHQGLLARDFTAVTGTPASPRHQGVAALAAALAPPVVVDTTTIGLLVTALAVGTVGLASVLPASLVVAGPCLGAWRWWRARRGAGALPPFLRWAVLAGLGALLAMAGVLHPSLDGAVPVFIALAWTKALELDTDREVHVLATLGLFANGACLLTDAGLGMFILASAGAALTGLALARHHGGPQTAAPLAAAVPLAVILFILVPRPSMSGTSLGGNPTARTGVTSLLSPDTVAANLEDPTPVFRAEVAAGAFNDWYWRAHVLWECDDRGSNWRPGIEPFLLRQDPPTLAGSPPRPVTCRVTLLPNCPVPPALGTVLKPPRSQLAAYGGLLRWRPGAVIGPVYDLEADLAAHDLGGSETSLRRALVLPRGLDPRIAATGATLTRPTAAATSAAIARWFTDEGFAYSLEPGVQADGMAGFLFGSRRGFCAHFAAGGVLLLRAAGVPARVVAGWRGGEWNPLGNHLVVRQLHAHAWCEYWGGSNTGWVRLDLTDLVPTVDPATGRADGPPMSGTAQAQNRDGVWHTLRMIPDYLAARWDLTVLGYDAEQRDLLLEQVGGWLRLLGLLALAAVPVVLWRRRQRLPPVAAAYGRYRKALARLGLERRPEEGPRDHARRAATARPDLEKDILGGADAYLRLTYAATAQADDLERLRACTRRLGRAQRP